MSRKDQGEKNGEEKEVEECQKEREGRKQAQRGGWQIELFARIPNGLPCSYENKNTDLFSFFFPFF